MEDIQRATPQKTWFFERGDGQIIPMHEKEAWEALNNKSNWKRRDFKLIGVSDGSTYFEYMRNSKRESQEVQEQIKEKERLLNKWVDTEDQLRFKYVVAEDDERLKRALTEKNKVQKELDSLQKKLSELTDNAIKKAMELEVEKAKGNIERPGRVDVQVPSSSERSKDFIIKQFNR